MGVSPAEKRYDEALGETARWLYEIHVEYNGTTNLTLVDIGNLIHTLVLHGSTEELEKRVSKLGTLYEKVMMEE